MNTKDESDSEKSKKDLDNIISRLNAMEVSTSDDHQKSIISILRMLVQQQQHTLNEIDHLKKALDLTLSQIFRVQNKLNTTS